MSAVGCICFSAFFFNDTATTEIYTLSLHDALPICAEPEALYTGKLEGKVHQTSGRATIYKSADGKEYLRLSDFTTSKDRKSTRLNSSHITISYAVFCLKKKKNNTEQH